MGRYIIVSAHVVGHTEEGGVADHIFTETVACVDKCRRSVRSRGFVSVVFVGTDANAILKPHIPGMTGPAALGKGDTECSRHI